LHLVSDTYATPIREWSDSEENTFLEIRCPSCAEVSTIKNVPTPKGFGAGNIGCRHCFFRFHLVSRWYPIRRVIIKTLGFRRVYWLNNIMR